MQGPEILIPIAGIAGVFGIPIVAIWTSHRQKMMEMKLKLQGGQVDTQTQVAVEELRKELKALRDTTLQYDLSFDTALQRMEQRVEGVERRVQSVEQNAGVQTEIQLSR